LTHVHDVLDILCCNGLLERLDGWMDGCKQEEEGEEEEEGEKKKKKKFF